MLLSLPFWLLSGLLVGSILSLFEEYPSRTSWLRNVALALAGAFIGGIFAWLVGFGDPERFLPGNIATSIFCAFMGLLLVRFALSARQKV